MAYICRRNPRADKGLGPGTGEVGGAGKCLGPGAGAWPRPALCVCCVALSSPGQDTWQQGGFHPSKTGGPRAQRRHAGWS